MKSNCKMFVSFRLWILIYCELHFWRQRATWNLFISCARLFAIVSQLVFHFPFSHFNQISLELQHALSRSLSHSPLLTHPLVVCDIIKLPAEELLCRAQACSVLEDLFELVDSSKWLVEMFYKLLVYLELCKILQARKGILRKMTPSLSDEMSYSYRAPKTSRTLCYLSKCSTQTPPQLLF